MQFHKKAKGKKSIYVKPKLKKKGHGCQHHHGKSGYTTPQSMETTPLNQSLVLSLNSDENSENAQQPDANHDDHDHDHIHQKSNEYLKSASFLQRQKTKYKEEELHDLDEISDLENKKRDS